MNYIQPALPIQLADAEAGIRQAVTMLQAGHLLLLCTCREYKRCHRRIHQDTALPPCTTRYEKRKKAAHEAAATRFRAGYWWCEKCEPQQLLIALGEETNYPPIHAHGKAMRPGRDEWLRFAQEAGYMMIQRALEAMQSRDGEEL